MAATTPVPFEARPIPPCELAFRDQILFLHPGYEEPLNTLLALPRVDRTATDPASFGVHHRTALLACQIIANNAFDGYLTLDQAGQQLVSVPLEDALAEDVYYFIVDNSLNDYPIVPSFQDWQFPHGRIPDSWPRSTSFSIGSDGIPRCSISNFSSCLEEAHLVPKEEVVWYQRNGMNKYGIGLGDINNAANLFLLKSDIHKCFDKRWLVIVPKVARAEDGSAQYGTHILSREAAEFWPSYHDTRIQYLHAQSRSFLFARFAWAVLLLVKPFVTISTPRHVIRIHVSIDANGKQKIEHEAKLLSGLQLADYYGGGGSKGATPKRKRLQGGSMVDGEDDVTESSSESSIEDSRGLWDVDMTGVWAEGGRRRRQLTSSETAPEILPLPVDKDMSEQQTAPSEIQMIMRLK